MIEPTSSIGHSSPAAAGRTAARRTTDPWRLPLLVLILAAAASNACAQATVSDLSTIPADDLEAGQPFGIHLELSSVPGVIIDDFRVVVLDDGETPEIVDLVWQTTSLDVTSGFAAAWECQLARFGEYRIAAQYSEDAGTTWIDCAAEAGVQNPLAIRLTHHFLTYPLTGIARVRVTSGYEYDDCWVSPLGHHHAIDYGRRRVSEAALGHGYGGFHVVAAADGVVETVGWDADGWGHYVTLKHQLDPDNVYYTNYAHLESASPLPDGAVVVRGQFLGWAGETGYADGLHLDFVLKAGANTSAAKVDPYGIEGTKDGLSCPDLLPEKPHYPFNSSQYDADLDTFGDEPEWGMGPAHYWITGTDGYPAYSDLAVPGYYADGASGWRTPASPEPGYSQAFIDAYNDYVIRNSAHEHRSLGVPYDNNGGGEHVHLLNGMHIQDFYGAQNGLVHPHSALIMGPEGVFVLKEGFWDRWMTCTGWISYGPPISDEEEVGTEIHQLFRTGERTYRFVWDGAAVTVRDEDGQLVEHCTATVLASGKAPPGRDGDGVFHSNLRIADIGSPFDLVRGAAYEGFYAVIGGVRFDIAPFVVNADMTIVAGDQDQTGPCLVSTLLTPTYTGELAVQGDYAYVGIHDPGLLQVVDISDPRTPRVAGSVSIPLRYINRIAAAGNLVFVANDNQGLKIVEVSDPAAPRILSEFYTAEIAQGVAHANGYAFVANYRGGLVAVDVRQPANPVLAGVIDTPAYAMDVVVDGDLAYIAHFSTVQIIDVSDPTSMSVVGWVETPPYAHDIFKEGDLLYVSNGDYGMQIVDASDPAAPFIVSSMTSINWVTDVFVDDGLAYVCDNYEGLYFVDVSDPAAPTIVDFQPLPAYVASVDVQNGYAFVGNSNSGLAIVQQHCGQVAPIGSTVVDLATVPAAVVAGNYFQVWTLVDGATGEHLDRFRIAILDLGRNLVRQVYGDTDLDMTAGYSGVQTAVVSTPGPYQLAVQYSQDGSGNWLDLPSDAVTDNPRMIQVFACDGGGAYHLDGTDQFLAVPDQPGLDLDSDWTIECWHTPATALAADELRALVSKHNSNTNRQQYMLGWRNDASGVGKTGVYVRVSSGGNDGTTISHLWEYAFQPGNPYHVAATYDQSAGRVEVFVNAVSLGAHSGFPTSVYDGSEDLRIGASGEGLFYHGAIDEVRISSAIRTPPEIETHFLSRQEHVDDGATLVLYHMNGDPGTAEKTLNAAASGIPALIERNAPVAAPGFDECDVASAVGSIPLATVELDAFPNPFNPETTIRFLLPSEQRVQLAVYSLAGHHVRDLADQVFASGAHAIPWDGRDARGRSVASGVYVVRMRMGAHSVSQKIALLK